MDAPIHYMEELRSELALYPTWFPNDPIELGVYGTLKRGKFYVDGRLGDLGVAIVSKDHAPSGNIKRSRGIKFVGKSSTQADAGLVDASIGVDLSIQREHAWAFGARGIRVVEIENMSQVRDAVMEAQKAGRWQREWLLVTEFRRADSLNVLIAKSKSVNGRIVAKGAIAAADVLVAEEASFDFQTDDVFAVENHRNATPLYGLRKLRGILNPGLKPVSAGGEQGESLSLETADGESFRFE